MQAITIGSNEAGQRLDKFLSKYLNLAGKSFLYKMIRKKNITLNGKKCEGAEKLEEGDVVRLFLSDETIAKFSEAHVPPVRTKRLDILYEDRDILLINKPAGMLSQKAKESDTSLVEYLTAYLLENGSLSQEDLRAFRPSVCNRLDRNTSGIVAAGKTLAGLQMLSAVFRDRTIHKYYQCVVDGSVNETKTVEGWLLKDEQTNQVRILRESQNGALQIKTKYEPLSAGNGRTLLKVTLYTGRSHQIRAHLASIGHPVLGDYKYGDPEKNEVLKKKYGVVSQLLHSFRLEFPDLPEPFAYLSGKYFEAPVPEIFLRVMRESRIK